MLEVLERGIPEAMAQMGETTDRFEAAFAQVRVRGLGFRV